jgi:hypothetical protein
MFAFAPAQRQSFPMFSNTTHNSAFLNSRFPKPDMAAMARQNSVTNGCFGEAKLQRPLSGSEVEKWAVVSRPNPAAHSSKVYWLL